MTDRVLILTPIKNAADLANIYARNLSRLTYPLDRISLGLLESDSTDGTLEAFRTALKGLRGLGRVTLWKRDFNYSIPRGMPRWEPSIQSQRRAVLARSRNNLLMRALVDEDWVLWLDADVVEYPPDIIERLLGYKKEILQPHCVKAPGGPTYDMNAWRDHGKVFMHELRGTELVELHSVGGTMLLIRADIHRDGLIFPPFFYGPTHPYARDEHEFIENKEPGEIETEGLALMAYDMGYRCWGLPDLEIIHRDR